MTMISRIVFISALFFLTGCYCMREPGDKGVGDVSSYWGGCWDTAKETRK